MIAKTRFSIQLAPLVCCLVTCAAASELTEKQALQLFRESPYHKELQAGIEVVRAKTRRHTLYPNPSVSATFEGAGRTDFFVVEQVLTVNGRRNLLRQAGTSAVKVAETQADHTLREIEARLRDVFYQLLYAQKRKAMIRKSVDELEELARILHEREKAGEGSKFDHLLAAYETMEQETEFAEAETLIAGARAKLASFLGERVFPDALVVMGALEPGYALPALPDALAVGLSARSDYRVETERLEQLRLEAEAADRIRIPNPIVLGGLKRTDIGDRYLNGPVLSVSIDLPVFEKGQVAKKLANAEADRTRARRRILESQILADVRSAHDSLRLRRRIADDYRIQSGRNARELLEIAEIAYREGELGILELLNSYGVAHRTELRLLELRAAAKLAEVEFDRSIAKELLP